MRVVAVTGPVRLVLQVTPAWRASEPVGAVCIGPQIVHRLLTHAGRTPVRGIDTVVQPLLGDFVLGRSGNTNDRDNTLVHRVLEVVQGVVPLVGEQVSGLEVWVQPEHGIQVRPQSGPLIEAGWSDGGVQRQSVVSIVPGVYLVPVE